MSLSNASKGATYEEIAASGGGIRSTVRKTRAATEDELLQHALKHAHWFLQNGTTTVEAKSGYGLSVEDELKLLRVIRRLNAESRSSSFRHFLARMRCRRKFGTPRSNMSRWSFTKCCRAWRKDNSRNTAIFFAKKIILKSPTPKKSWVRRANTACACACMSIN